MSLVSQSAPVNTGEWLLTTIIEGKPTLHPIKKSSKTPSDLINTHFILLTAGSWGWLELQPREEPRGGGEPLSLPERSGLGWN